MIEELKYLISILISVILGFLIGYERKLRFKEAGIRTHTIVCAGSYRNTVSVIPLKQMLPAWLRRLYRASDF